MEAPDALEAEASPEQVKPGHVLHAKIKVLALGEDSEKGKREEIGGDGTAYAALQHRVSERDGVLRAKAEPKGRIGRDGRRRDEADENERGQGLSPQCR